jgi:PAS domain S-box-containing protein
MFQSVSIDETKMSAEINYNFIDFLPDAVLVQMDGKIIYVNEELLKLLKCKGKESIIGKSFLDLVVQTQQNKALDSLEGSYSVKDFQSNILDLDVRCKIKFIEKREYQFFTLRAASKTRYLENELNESKELYKKLIDILPDGICIHNGETYSFASDSYAKILDYEDPYELVGKHLEQVITKENYEAMKQGERDLLLRDEKIARGEYRFMTKKGRPIAIETTSIRFYHNKSLNILTSIRDITKKKEAEDSKLLLDKAIEYDKLKTEFFSNMSHELRTPLNILLSSLQLINLYINDIEKDKVSAVKKYISIMRQNCYRLLRLINNLMDITKIDAGFYRLSLTNCNIVGLVEDITQSVADYTKNKNIDIIFDTDIEEKIIACDTDKIERVILNLLSNAVKFTKPGGKIEVTLTDIGDYVRIVVRDTGIGIPIDKLDSVFDRFIQVDKSLSRRSEGTGIGLALVKSLVEMHGGIINLSSVYGEYTEFDIRFPSVTLDYEGESVLSSSVIENSFVDKKVERMTIEFSDIYLQ